MKFSEALPQHLPVASLAARLADLEGAVRVLAEQARVLLADN
ncbi:hypothetical protein [Kutzneria sp. CA-103260]|nr:hypothetical protein [Kutzneria sp. CA-103260]